MSESKGKDLLQSKQTWGAIIFLVTPILAQFGIDVTQDQADQFVETAVKAVDVVGQIVGAVIYVIGTFSKNRAPITTVAGVSINADN